MLTADRLPLALQRSTPAVPYSRGAVFTTIPTSMTIIQFPCPHCSAPLRMKNRQLVGRVIGCPDCGDPLEIVADGPRNVTVRKPEAGKPGQASLATAIPSQSNRATRNSMSQRSLSAVESHNDKSRLGSLMSACLTGLMTPVGISWTVAGGGALVILVFLVLPASEPDQTETPPNVLEDSIAETESPAVPVGNGVQPEAAPVSAQHAPPAKSTESNDSRITEAESSPPQEAATPDFPPSPEPPPPAVAEIPDFEDAPPIPPARPPKTVDIAAALKQSILRFEQAKPVPLSSLLLQIEELIGAPIDYESREFAELSPKLEADVTLKLERTNVERILQGLLDQVGLSYEILPDRIRLHVASPVAPANPDQ